MFIIYIQGYVWYCASYDRVDELNATDSLWITPLSNPWTRA
jgi:hypothetical protein